MAKINVKHYTDKYFTYTREILEKEGLDPWVTMQVFIRKGPGKLWGMKEAVDTIIENSGIEWVNGRIWALENGQKYHSNETIMLIEAPLQLIVELETIYLGIISKNTTRENEGSKLFDFDRVTKRMQGIVGLVGDRPVYYFGARHWHYAEDQGIGLAAFNGGAAGCSTDAGATMVGQKGIGTMPHVLPIIMNSTVAAGIAFDEHIDPAVKRVVLVDTFNREVTDSIEAIGVLYNNNISITELAEWRNNPAGVRLDTCGENIGETCHYKPGVTVELAKNVRLALDRAGYQESPITLSSGFADISKVAEFVAAEKALGIRLFDSLGVGQLFESRSVTADIVKVNGELCSKTGREFRPNKRLKRVL